MKKSILILISLILTSTAFAQVPAKMSYQAVIRNAANEIVVNNTVGMQISIMQGAPSGTAVYTETHSAITNDNGLVSLEIGNGTPVSGNMADIDWKAGPYFVLTAIDPTGGTNYSITGASELLSVPYAMFTEKTDTAEVAVRAINAQRSQNADSAFHSQFAHTSFLSDMANSAMESTLSDSAKVADFAWNSPAKPRSIVITPGMINSMYMGGGAAHGWLGWRPCIDMPEGGNFVEFAISVPVPADFSGTKLHLKVLYSSPSTTGDFLLGTYMKGATLGEDLSTWVGGGNTILNAPATANFLEEGMGDLTFGVNPNTKALLIWIRRISANASDTATDTMKIVGLVLEYE